MRPRINDRWRIDDEVERVFSEDEEEINGADEELDVIDMNARWRMDIHVAMRQAKAMEAQAKAMENHNELLSKQNELLELLLYKR